MSTNPATTLPICGYSTASWKLVSRANPMGWAPRFAREGWVGVIEDWRDRLARIASGLFLSRAPGACVTRDVGRRSDGEVITTEVASDDMLSAEDHRLRVPFIRGLVYSTDLYYYTSLPDDAPGCLELALRRIRELHVRRVGVDVIGQNITAHCERFVGSLLDAGVTVYAEPWCLERFDPPSFAGSVKAMSLPGRFMAPDVRDIPPGSIAIHNTNNPFTEEHHETWAALGVKPSIARSRLLADAGVIDDGDQELDRERGSRIVGAA